jgi:ATPase subunit of ABC transporter with duplicated ATPase domains
MLTTANITIQFSAKPLFENVSVKFGDGNRYGLIGATSVSVSCSRISLLTKNTPW